MCSAIEDVNSRVSTLRLLVALLPPVNRDTLWYLLTFLGCVAKHADDQLDDARHNVINLQIQYILSYANVSAMIMPFSNKFFSVVTKPNENNITDSFEQLCLG